MTDGEPELPRRSANPVPSSPDAAPHTAPAGSGAGGDGLPPSQGEPRRTWLELAGTRMELLGEARALWLPGSRTLAVGDIHLGKATTLRRAGLAVPEGSDRDDLRNLSDLVKSLQPRTLLILGDLVHAPAGFTNFLIQETQAALASWRTNGLERAVLIRGNHDRVAWPDEAGLEEKKHLELDGLGWVHDPRDAVAQRWTVAAHLHPLARVGMGRGRSQSRVRGAILPCFWLQKETQTLVLPTFGRSLSGRCWERADGDRIWVCAPGTHRAREVA